MNFGEFGSFAGAKEEHLDTDGQVVIVLEANDGSISFLGYPRI